jgi:hypothetical protein
MVFPSAPSVRTRGFGVVSMTMAARLFLKVEGVAMLIGSEEGAVHQDAAVDEIEPPATGAFEDARDLRSGSGFLGSGGKNLGDHLAKCAQQQVTGTSRGSLPEETQRRMARSSAFLGGLIRAKPCLGLRRCRMADWLPDCPLGWLAWGLAFATFAS